MEVTRYSDAHQFWAASSAFLQQHIAENNLAIGLLDRELNTVGGAFEDQSLIIVYEHSAAVLTVMQFKEKTTGQVHPYMISWDVSDRLAPTKALFEYLKRNDELDRMIEVGFHCSEKQSQFLLALLEADGKPKLFCVTALWNFVLGKLNDSYLTLALERNANGKMRHANAEDESEVKQLKKMLSDFCVELPATGFGPSRASAWADRLLRNKKLWVWVINEDRFGKGGEIVSLAGCNRELPTASAVGPVYTPPAFRGKGYASCLVGELSRKILTEGKGMAILNTDASNAKSNFVYESLGYKKVSKEMIWRKAVSVSSLEVRSYSEMKQFWNDSRSLLENYTAENGLIIGLIDRGIKDPNSYEELVLLLVTQGGAPALVAIQTKDNGNFYPMAISVDSSAELKATRSLFEHLKKETLIDRFAEIGFRGSEKQTALLLSLLAENGKTGLVCHQSLWIYRLTKLNDEYLNSQLKKHSNDKMRLANAEDEAEVKKLEKWVVGFLEDVREPVSLASGFLKRMLQTKKLWVWETSEKGEIVSMAGSTRELPNAASVGPVYSPPQFRGKGYASCIVGELSRKILSEKGMALLYADDRNPTSNFIYQSLGYERVCLEHAWKSPPKS